MSDFKTLSAILIPVERHEPIVPMVGTKTALFRHAGIETPNFIRNAVHCRDQHFVALAEDLGQDKGLALNGRAVLLTGYPGRLLGNILFMGEQWDDEGMGLDLASVPDTLMPWINENLAILISDFMAKTKPHN